MSKSPLYFFILLVFMPLQASDQTSIVAEKDKELHDSFQGATLFFTKSFSLLGGKDHIKVEMYGDSPKFTEIKSTGTVKFVYVSSHGRNPLKDTTVKNEDEDPNVVPGRVFFFLKDELKNGPAATNGESTPEEKNRPTWFYLNPAAKAQVDFHGRLRKGILRQAMAWGLSNDTAVEVADTAQKLLNDSVGKPTPPGKPPLALSDAEINDPQELVLQHKINDLRAEIANPSEQDFSAIALQLHTDMSYVYDAAVDAKLPLPDPDQNHIDSITNLILNTPDSDAAAQLADEPQRQSALPPGTPVIDNIYMNGVIPQDSIDHPKIFQSFASDSFPLKNYHRGGHLKIQPKDLSRADAWMAGWSTANNATISSGLGQESLGDIGLWRCVSEVKAPPGDLSRHYNVFYYIYYAGVGKSKGKVTDIAYGVYPELEFGLYRNKTFNAVLNGYESLFEPALPDISYDKKTGLQIGIDLKSVLIAGPGKNPVHTSDPSSLTPDSKNGLTVNANVTKSVDHDFYSVKSGPEWTFANGAIPTWEAPTLGLNGVSSKAPQGTGTKSVDGAEIVGEMKKASPDKQNQTTLDFSLDYDHTLGDPVTVKPPSVNTDEYSLTLFFQNITYVPDRSVVDLKNMTDQSPDAEFDVSTWVKPDESTQNSDLFGDGVGRLHLGADVPIAWGHYARIDVSTTGGGIIGTSPTTSRFFAGSNLNESATESDTVPSPVIRSLGTNSAGVYSQSGSSGATAYVNEDFTLAFPLFIPFLEGDTVVDPLRKENFLQDANSLFLSDVQTENELYYMANFERFYSIKPLITCDAVWLGAPAGFSDRTICSLGLGGELSLGVLNLDFVYARTVLDTSTQQKSGNLTFQATYDIHF